MAKLGRVIFFTYLGLVIFGILFITNSSVVDAYREFGNQWIYLIKQAIWVLISIISYLVISRQPLKKLYSNLTPVYWMTILLLLLVLLPGVGQQIQGARRWLNFGFFSLQPSEFIKGVLVLYLPYLIHVKKVTPRQFLFWGFLPVGLVLIQPDFGTAIVISSLVIGLYLLSNLPLKDLLKYIPIGLIILTVYIVSSPYRLQRIQTYFSGYTDPLENSYQSRQSLIAIGNGGLMGIGFGQSRQKYNFLPESSTDSIFSIIAEETGLFGSTLLIILLLIIITVSFRIAVNSSEAIFSHTAAGIGLLISTQALLNLGAITGLLPLTGVPLPFISYGGSSLLNFTICLAVLTAIAKND